MFFADNNVIIIREYNYYQAFAYNNEWNVIILIDKIKVYTSDSSVNALTRKKNTEQAGKNTAADALANVTYDNEHDAKNTNGVSLKDKGVSEEIINTLLEKVNNKIRGEYSELKDAGTSGVSTGAAFAGFLLKVFIEIAIWIFVLLLAVSVIIFAASKTPKKTFLGFSCYAIEDECLEPDYNVGDCIITGAIDAAEIEVGNFITFIDDGTYSAGIVDSTLDNYKNINAKFFRVKDAYNNTYIVEPKDITGREVCRFPGWGYIVRLLGSKTLYN